MISSLNLAEIAADQFVQTGMLALVGALLTHVLLRHYPTRRLVVQITFFVALTVLLLHCGIIPYELAPADKPVFERVFVALLWMVTQRTGWPSQCSVSSVGGRRIEVPRVFRHSWNC
jgi:hypothetical protein